MTAEYDPELDELIGARLVLLHALGGPKMEIRLRTDEGRTVFVYVTAKVYMGKGFEPEADLDVTVVKEVQE